MPKKTLRSTSIERLLRILTSELLYSSLKSLQKMDHFKVISGLIQLIHFNCNSPQASTTPCADTLQPLNLSRTQIDFGKSCSTSVTLTRVLPVSDHQELKNELESYDVRYDFTVNIQPHQVHINIIIRGTEDCKQLLVTCHNISPLNH